MNKSDLINVVTEATELPKKDATKAVDAVFEAITGALQSGDKVQVWLASETLKCANVPHVKAATRRLVKKSKFLQAKYRLSNPVKR